MKIADANYYLRYLVKDNIQQNQVAKDFFESNEIYLPIEVLSEVVYVLSKVYKIGRNEISNGISIFLDEQTNIQMESRAIVFQALFLFGDTSLDFVDCLLASYNKINGDTIYTFDEKLKKTIERIETT